MLLACAPKSADTEDTGSSAGATEGTEATDTTPTTSATPTSADPTAPPPTSNSASASATGTSTSTSTSTDTGDDTSSGGLPGACAAVCMHWEMCSPGSAGPVDVCTANCIEGFEIPSECAMATATQWDCVAGLACEEALKFIAGPDVTPTSCLAELGAADAACDDIGCGGEISGGDEFCEFEQQCGNGTTQNYRCDTADNLCTCTEDDVAGMQCPADGFCSLGPAEQRAAITACCGWVWM